MSEPHQLAIKVLRLGRPQLQTNQFDKPGLYTEELVLPKSIGPCFAGEQFRCLLSVIAEKETENAHMIVELQHNNERDEIVNEKGIKFGIEVPITRKLEVQLKEAGHRLLSVQIKYNDGELSRTLSKNFSFEVSPAINLKTRTKGIVYPPNVEPKLDDTVEVQVENCTESMVTITGLEFNHESFTFHHKTPSPVLLKPRDIYSYSIAVKGSSKASHLGTATVHWSRDPLGYKGSLTVDIRR